MFRASARAYDASSPRFMAGLLQPRSTGRAINARGEEGSLRILVTESRRASEEMATASLACMRVREGTRPSSPTPARPLVPRERARRSSAQGAPSHTTLPGLRTPSLAPRRLASPTNGLRRALRPRAHLCGSTPPTSLALQRPQPRLDRRVHLHRTHAAAGCARPNGQ